MHEREWYARRPHPVPYQGSKRLFAARILGHIQAPVDTLIEPFAGSAAVTIAAAMTGKAKRFVLADSLGPLIGIWQMILGAPTRLADEYEALWRAQLPDPRYAYDRVRATFNRSGSPSHLLYLLVRCVKNAVRFNARGAFNQSPDNRRLGMRPDKMRKEIASASRLLAGRTRALSCDHEEALALAGPTDLVYLDPPYQGTSGGRNPRYFQPLDRARFIHALEALNTRNIRYLVSFDGRCGDTRYGQPLPASLGLRMVELEGGVSAQATLAGRRALSVESLYLSPSLA